MGLNAYESIEDAIHGCFGENVSVKNRESRFGGDINEAGVLHLTDGNSVFIKSNSIANKGFFDAEEEGIRAIEQTNTVSVPHLICKGIDRSKNCSFLMMDVIRQGSISGKTFTEFGYAFADMHMADTSEFVENGRFGFLHDNYIGASVQVNTPKENWIDFFRECRLEVQFRMAERALGSGMMKSAIRLLDRLDDVLTEPSKPSLLHGDMWGGNYMINSYGRGVLIDPAAYVGHPEADMAMTEMFRPMPTEFYKAYYEKLLKEDGYEDRKEIYNLYHFLNHLNLFGDGYYDAVARTVRRF